ncbi:MAG: M13 family metallopeptidase [Erysipelotrichaceae bacterium]|nr:M13 family metallopeptidase [Erysipelotrichaceae bacterium]
MENIRIQDDLYEVVNGKWLKEAVIPEDRPTIGGFASLAVEVEEIMMADFRAFGKNEKTSDITGVKDAIKLYQKVLDVEKRNDAGIKPLMPLLNKIKDLHCPNCLNREALELTYEAVNLPFDFGVVEDMDDATKHSFIIKGPDTILPDTSYYGTEEGEALLNVYKDMALKLLNFTDLSEEEKEVYINDCLAFDELLSKEVKSAIEWADYVKNNNPLELDKAIEYLKPFDLNKLLKNIYDEQLPEKVVAYDLKAIENFKNYFNSDTFDLYKHWAYVTTLINKSSLLSEEMKSISTIYSRSLTGVEKDPSLEKQAYQIASGVFSEPLGIYYGRTYFGEEAKKDIVSLVKRIIETYKKRIENNTFLEEATKQKAILKLSTISIKMGYPDKVKDIYSNMQVDENDTYYECMQKIRRLLINENFNKLFKSVDKNEWQMPGHLVNACYDPSRNDITFPAAILQKPFYSLKQTVSENLGGIGAVIAHEISHAFDNNGAHFDENGNMNNWWTESDLKNFEDLTKKMIKQWDGLPFAGDKVNGELVVSENIADNGGMACTIQLMHETEGTDFEEYFKNWARIWCQKAKPEYQLLLLKNDVHSPVRLRANIQVRNFREWYDTFNVKSDDEMYIPEEDRIIIW